MKKKFFSDLQSQYPTTIVSCISELLELLIVQKHAQSLERLQLKHITVSLQSHLKNNSELTVANMRLEKKQDNTHNVTLLGDLFEADNPCGTLSIAYFLRGQKKFFAHEHNEGCGIKIAEIEPITQRDIAEFFSSSTKNNWYDDSFATLNGLESAQVPSQLVAALHIGYAYENFSWLPHMPKQFQVKFYRSIAQNKSLRIEKDEEGNLWTFDDNALLVSVHRC